MIARGPFLRAIINRKVILTGDYTIGLDSAVELKEVNIPKILAGETKIIETTTNIFIKNHNMLGWVEYHPSLVVTGTLTGPRIITKDTIVHKDNSILFRYEADVDSNLHDLPYIIKIYFEALT